MTIFETINSLPILEVLDSFGISYAKNGTGYVITRDDGRKDESFSISISDNIVKDFGKSQIQGGPFDFIGRYILNEDTQTNIGKANTVKLFIEKGLVQAPDNTTNFVKTLKSEELLERFDEFKLNGYKKEISAFLLTRGVNYDWIQKNNNFVGEIFKDIGYYDNYFTTEFETYKDEQTNKWINKEGDEPKTVGVFMFPCYDQFGTLIGLKLRRKDGKTIRGKKSLAVGKTGLLYNEIDLNEAIIVEGETDYIILKLLGYKSVVGNLGGVQACRSMLKSLLTDSVKIICLYDNDTAGENGKKALEETFGRSIYDVEFPIREDQKGKKLSDVNDLYKVGYDTKQKWDSILSTTKTLGERVEKKEEVKVPRFVALDKYLEYYDTKYKRIQKTDSVAAHLGMTKKELSQAVNNKSIPCYEDLCYRAGGKPGFYNTLDESVIVKTGGDAEPILDKDIEYLINNIAGNKKKNADWIHSAILYKLTHLNDVHVPALILYGIGGSGKGTFLHLLSNIFGEINTQIGLGQKDLEGQFDSYQGDKLIVEFKEVSSGNKHQDKKTLDRIKSFVGEPIISVNAKFQNARKVENIAWFHMSSNHPVPIQLDSKHSGNRRFTIIKTGGKINIERAERLNNEVIDNPLIVRQYVSWLYTTFPEVIELGVFPALDNDEKRNLEDNCEGVANQFFEWLEELEPGITKISIKQKNMLVSKYCNENGEDQYDQKWKQSNFDLGLSHRYEKVRFRIGGILTRGYIINKTDFEMKHLPEREREFLPGEIEKMSGVTF